MMTEKNTDTATKDEASTESSQAPANAAVEEPGSDLPPYEIVDRAAWEAAKAATAEAAGLRDKILRVQADLDNHRKRVQREKEELAKYANENLLLELLPVIDNFELGLKAADQSHDAKSIALGMQMVKTQLDRFLEGMGVETIDAEGGHFDPDLHDAVGKEITTDADEGAILQQQRKGYKLRGRLLRPASVIVAQAPDKENKD
jgi:molecular chaperone GrpE